jgi:serine/threonine-protein kinase
MRISVVGAVIGNYQLVRKLGEGGMGVVYLGQHILLGRRAALKVLLPELSVRPAIVSRFFNEARAVTSISDPGIVQVFDFGYHSDGSAFIVMEYLEGETLEQRLARRGRFAVPDALRLCRQLASSLAAAHAQQIVHRDLKPENIFLVHDSEAPSGERSKILDFGIAKLIGEHGSTTKTSTGTVIGTPMYMSPEQCRGVPDIDHRSDVYSLGCVLFQLVCGRPPFLGAASGDITSAHIREPAPVPSSLIPELPSSIDALVLRCLAKAPNDRFPTMAELAATAAALLQQQPASSSIALVAQRERVLPGGFPPAGAPSTTLRISSGQFTAAPQVRRALRLWIAIALGVGVAAGAVAITVTRNTETSAATTGTVASVHGDRDSSSISDRNLEQPRIPDAGAVPLAVSQGKDVALQPAPSPGDPDPIVLAPAIPVAAPAPARVARPDGRAPELATPGLGPPAVRADDLVRPAKPSADQPAKAGAPDLSKVVSSAQGSRPHQIDKPEPPIVVSPPVESNSARLSVPLSHKCSKAVFAAVYNAGTPTNDQVYTALNDLKVCHDLHQFNDADYDQMRDALVARL